MTETPSTTAPGLAGAGKAGHWQFLPMYAVGFFCLSLQPMTGFLIPLWALRLEASPLMIGIAVSAGSLLPMIFSISAGALVDQRGAKWMLRRGSVLLVVLSGLPPLLPTIGALIVIQLAYGQAQSMAWIAIQTYLAKLSRDSGDAGRSGLFTFAVGLGTLVGPLLAGLLWDHYGPHAAFIGITAWAAGLLTACLLLPTDSGRPQAARKKLDLDQFRPRWHDYQRAFALLAAPAVLLVVYATFLRLAGYSMRASFYTVYLQQIAFSATTIAFLFSCFSVVSTVSPLAAGVLSRRIRQEKLLFACAFVGLLPLCLTPLFTDLLTLTVLAAISGFGLGLTLPLLITVLAGGTEDKEQGIAIGLRTSANRLAATCIPLLFGLLAQGMGLNISFYMMGVLLLLPMAIIAPRLLRRIEASKLQYAKKGVT